MTHKMGGGQDETENQKDHSENYHDVFTPSRVAKLDCSSLPRCSRTRAGGNAFLGRVQDSSSAKVGSGAPGWMPSPSRRPRSYAFRTPKSR